MLRSMLFDRIVERKATWQRPHAHCSKASQDSRQDRRNPRLSFITYRPFRTRPTSAIALYLQAESGLPSLLFCVKQTLR